MKAIAELYASDSDEETETAKTLSINPAPNVSTTGLKVGKFHDLNTKVINYNPKVNELFAPIQGPLLPNETRDSAFQPKKTTLTGHVEIDHMDSFTFDSQYHTFMNYGYALNPSIGQNTLDSHKITSKYVGNKESVKENRGMTVFDLSNKLVKKRKKKARKRLRQDDASDIDGYLGPWAPIMQTEEEEKQYKEELKKRKEEWERERPLKRRKLNPKNEFDSDYDSDKNNSNNNLDELTEKEKLELKAKKRKERYEQQIKIESSELHIEKMTDYQGRTFIHCPVEKRNRNNNSSKYYIPKKRIYTWIGHKKGVNAIQWFPKTGHLLLSASNDTTVKIWNVYGKRECIRTYNGHSAGVRNICFTKDGSKFLTTSYDRWMKLFDVEYGKVIWRGTSGKIPFNATLYPDNENEFICGQKNKVAVQWDTRSNKIVQIYSEHLSAVNAVLFIDNNRRFITTSDDKKIFVWDYGTPVVIKHISEPHLHSVPYVTLHPNKKWFLGQSLDNQIVTYEAKGRFKQVIKKNFKGHISAGYCSQIDVSPDGRFVMSGDAQGRLFFWDWKTCRKYSSFKAHDEVTMGCIWHPIMTSRVATCSWDATIRYWD